MGDHAVTGGPDAREPGAHVLIHHHGAPRTETRSRTLEELRVGAHTDDDEHEVRGLLEGPALVGAADRQAPRGLLDTGDSGAHPYPDAVGSELLVDEGAEFGVEGGEHLPAALELGHVQAAGSEGLRHLQADVPGADDDHVPFRQDARPADDLRGAPASLPALAPRKNWAPR